MTLRRKRRRQMSEINIVPYIDVMLVLLVIFMITAPLLTQGVNVNLPHAKAKAIPMKNRTPIVVSVDRGGNYYVNISPTPTVPLEASQLVNLVAAELTVDKQQHSRRAVYVKGDQSVSYGKIMQAMVLLQRAGAPSVGLLTQSPNHAKTQ